VKGDFEGKSIRFRYILSCSEGRASILEGVKYKMGFSMHQHGYVRSYIFVLNSRYLLWYSLTW